MFKQLPPTTKVAEVNIQIDGTSYEVPSDVTAASAVLMATKTWRYRTHLNNEARAPYCMMGVCHECLLTIDGIANQQACLVTVKPGMQIERQRDDDD